MINILSLEIISRQTARSFELPKNMLKLLVVTLLAAGALADLSSVVDDILAQTRNRLADTIAYRPLHYAYEIFNPETRDYDAVGDFTAQNGHLLLGNFKRDKTPVLYGNNQERILESTFLIDLKVQYDNFKAVNFTSKEESEGSMLVSYGAAQMFTWIRVLKEGSQCRAEVSTYTPISLTDPDVVFTTSSPDLAKNLFSRAVYTVNFFINQTLVDEGLPAFADVVSKSSSLCTLLQ